MIDRIVRWWWHYQAANFARAEAKDRQVEALRSKAIAVRKGAEVVRSDLMRRSFRRADGRLAR